MVSQVDFSSEPIEAYGTNISQVVYTDLHIVAPLITLDLLKYPKLCHSYFSLLSHILEVYPEIIAQLNVEAFTHILGTLEFGLRHQDVEVVDLCLRAINALASHRYKDRSAGKVGLGSHANSYNDPDGNFHGGILSRFLRLLLQLLLFEDYSSDFCEFNYLILHHMLLNLLLKNSLQLHLPHKVAPHVLEDCRKQYVVAIDKTIRRSNADHHYSRRRCLNVLICNFCKSLFC